ncbi:CPBP family intramembrane glutamic endopeptidase [Kineosporia babensis]|uniref:CAAX prenyl protease 2/Lysostaphin resistance protein A-like domain-containing protein n=1 Tax=Kineosporia babensis TaxID=499548 RepID=A0A9X1NA40_9ACTN|nr:CPBP family intramembrane glutamic endopeptidase [Kineosporia babensis]MCD5309516.1 hypothetical protein [Kineosporia babensis]
MRDHWGPALLGWCSFVVALATAGFAVEVLEQSVADPPDLLAKAVPAVIVLAIAVPAVLLVHRRDRSVLALARPGQALTGILVTFAAAAVVIGPAWLAGWISFTSLDGAALLGFLVVNSLVALALEAVPEELAFRGSVYGSLRGALRPRWAGVVATASFVLAPGASIALAAAAGKAFGVVTEPVTFAPGGQDPISYAMLLTCFGAVLLLAREATGSIWTAVGLHLSFLTVNRIVFSDDRDTGIGVSAEAGAELLVLAYLLLAALALAGLRRRLTPQVVS